MLGIPGCPTRERSMLKWIRDARVDLRTGLIVIVLALLVWAVVVYVNLRDTRDSADRLNGPQRDVVAEPRRDDLTDHATELVEAVGLRTVGIGPEPERALASIRIG